LVSVALIVVATMLRLRHPSVVDIYLDAIAWSITSIALGCVVARAVFAAGRVSYHRVIGAVLLYLDVGIIFVALFSFVALLVPNAFNGLPPLQDNLGVASNLIYFSFATLTTVGYGDIVPLHPVARGLANVEAIIGQLYPATLLARFGYPRNRKPSRPLRASPAIGRRFRRHLSWKSEMVGAVGIEPTTSPV
jgi:Ion channel